MNIREQSCYSSWIHSKTGIALPCYADGKPSASVYNPEKEAQSFASLEIFAESGFILIAGIGAALHLNALAKRLPNVRIAAVEANTASVQFVLQNPNIKLAKNIGICTVDTVYDFLLSTYFPPLDGNFCLFPLRSWAQANAPLFERIKKSTDNALKDIGADISTQARFGKIWHKNIISNLYLYSQAGLLLSNFEHSNFPTDTTAFVAAAGPGLESYFEVLKQKRSAYYIIATDTAFGILSAQDIQADAVVSIDPQQLSINHFHTDIRPGTLFVCDLCCCPAVTRKAVQSGAQLMFFKSAHPLCSLIEMYRNLFQKQNGNLFPFFDCSSGTVTLTALDFALKAGFKHITTGGADFCYSDGKAYAAGSYFDTLFGTQSNRLLTCEQQFCALMYKSELEPLKTNSHKRSFTTALLKQYRRSFDKLCAEHPQIESPYKSPIELFDTAEIPIQKKEHGQTSRLPLKISADTAKFPFKAFCSWYTAKLQSLCENDEKMPEKAVRTSILPYIAWYAKHRDGNIGIKKIAAEIADNQKNICTIQS